MNYHKFNYENDKGIIFCKCNKPFKNVKEFSKHLKDNKLSKGKNLINIDIDLIRELKKSGKVYEAITLYEAYRKDVKKQGRQAVNNLLCKDRRIKRLNNICISNNCFNKTKDNKARCKECRVKRNYYQRKKLKKLNLK